jgi:hypothetical protein
MDAGRTGKCCAVAFAAMAVLVIDSGCVKRRYTIRTDPPGALVYVNGEEVGTSPVSRSYTYYGAREVVVVSDGYKTERVIQPFDAPWWDNGLTDFFTENLLPVTLRDEREFDYRLVPATNPSPNEVLTRAQGLKQRAQQPPPAPRRTFWQWIGLTQ